MSSFFLDSNLLIYLATSEGEKYNRINSILNADETAFISIQVLNEFTAACLKKQLLDHFQIEKYVHEYKLRFETVDVNFATVSKCFAIREKHKYSWYDSLIITTALQNNCKILYSEDMQHNQLIENSLKIVNPFV